MKSPRWVRGQRRVWLRRFFLYFLIMALINQVAITLFRTIGAIGRAAVLCNVASFIYIAFTLMLCGFIITEGRGISRPACLL